MGRLKRKGPRSAATARRPRNVAIGKRTTSHKPFDERMANARRFLDRRHLLRAWVNTTKTQLVQRQ